MEFEPGRESWGVSSLEELVAHTGLEPVISALRGQRVNQLHQCATVGLWDYRCRLCEPASWVENSSSLILKNLAHEARRSVGFQSMNTVTKGAPAITSSYPACMIYS